MDFEDMMKNLMSDSDKKETDFKSTGDAKKALEKFITSIKDYDYEVGDYIERNQYGIKRFKLPQKNQVMRVLYIEKDPRNYVLGENASEVTDVLVAVALKEDTFTKLWVDGSCYKKAGNRDNVIKAFGL